MEILRRAAELADEGKLKSLLNSARFTSDLDAAYAAVEAGAVGKVVWEFSICVE